ncbi:MAG: Uma2 family endonuclease [Dehalococcoidia bacterium]
MSQMLTARRFSIEEYQRMGKYGILQEDERIELIEGEIIRMAAIGSRHAGTVKHLNMRFSAQAAGRFLVSVQDPIWLPGDSEPEPDIALLRPRADYYTTSHPTPQDILLVVEVADSSLGYDRRRKLPLYAAAGIPELWIFNLTRNRLERNRDPQGRRYQQRDILGKEAVLSPLLLPDVTISVGAILAWDPTIPTRPS